jgi:hypothetical protein
LIQFIDEAIETFLRRAVPLPEAVADVSFAAPDRAWGAGVTRPTVNVFLWDIRRNQAMSTTGLGQQYSDGHQALRRPTDPVVDLRYLVTAWASEQRDEHQLLGAVLRCVLANSALGGTDLPRALADTPFVKLALASEETRVPGEFWSSLDGRLKPGLQVVVTLPVGAFEWVPAGPPATSVSVTAKPFANGATSEPIPEQPIPEGPIPEGPIPEKTEGETEIGDRPRPRRTGMHPLRRWRRSGALTMEGRPPGPGEKGQAGG